MLYFWKNYHFLLSPTPQQEKFPEDLTRENLREYLAAEIRDFQRSKNQKSKIYKNLEVIGILKTSEKAKSNSVYPTLLRGEKCLSYKIGEKWYYLVVKKRVFSTAVI